MLSPKLSAPTVRCRFALGIKFFQALRQKSDISIARCLWDHQPRICSRPRLPAKTLVSRLSCRRSGLADGTFQQRPDRQQPPAGFLQTTRAKEWQPLLAVSFPSAGLARAALVAFDPHRLAISVRVKLAGDLGHSAGCKVDRRWRGWLLHRASIRKADDLFCRCV